MGKSYFLTGATGFVGRYILKELLITDSTSCIKLLVRGSGGYSGQTKVDQLLRTMFSPAEYGEYRKRIEVFEGDVSLHNLGLVSELYDRLAETTNVIFHAAASIQFDLTLEAATKINVEGTRSALKLANACMKNQVLERMNHISTAYVTGKQKRSPGAPDDVEFANTYELTKFQSEKLVGSYIDAGLPITIYRPSIIFGHSVTGEITASNILYRFILLFSRKMIPVFPCQAESSLNIISINYFIELLFLISKLSGSVGKTYNITNPANSNMRELIETACEELGTPIPQFVPISQKNVLQPKVGELLDPFINYFEQSHYFDLSETHKLLGGRLWSEDNLTDGQDMKACMKRVIGYCCNQRLLRTKERANTMDSGAVKNLQIS